MTSRNNRGATGLFTAHNGGEVGTTQVRLFVEGRDDCSKRLLACHHKVVNLFDNACFGKLVVIASRLETLVIGVALVKFHREFFHDGIEVAGKIFSDQKVRHVASNGDVGGTIEGTAGHARDARFFLGIVDSDVVNLAFEQECD